MRASRAKHGNRRSGTRNLVLPVNDRAGLERGAGGLFGFLAGGFGRAPYLLDAGKEQIAAVLLVERHRILVAQFCRFDLRSYQHSAVQGEAGQHDHQQTQYPTGGSQSHDLVHYSSRHLRMKSVRSRGNTPCASAFCRHLIWSMWAAIALARRSSASGSTARTIITRIGVPSDSNWNSYFTPLASVALQATLDTFWVAKLPTCLQPPVASTVDGTGSPSLFGRSLDFSSMRSTV